MPNDATDHDWQTRPAAANDLAWLLDIGNKTAFANGFTPRTAIADHIDRGDYTILDLRGQRAAFMFTSGGRRSPFRIVQSAVSLELWRQGYGERLFGAVTLRAISRPIAATTCAVREGLASNQFWQAIGAQHVDTTPGGKSRHRMLHHYAWSAVALHHHAIQAAGDPRHQIPERDTAAKLIERYGFLPCVVGVPRTPTGDAIHHAGISIPRPPTRPRPASTPPPTLHRPPVASPPVPEIDSAPPRL